MIYRRPRLDWAPRDSRRGNAESFYDIRGCANVTLDGADRGACGIEEICRNFADAIEAGRMSDAQRAKYSSREVDLDSCVAWCSVTALGRE